MATLSDIQVLAKSNGPATKPRVSYKRVRTLMGRALERIEAHVALWTLCEARHWKCRGDLVLLHITQSFRLVDDKNSQISTGYHLTEPKRPEN
ncbi:hypothetical protein P7K49_026473 [Saguinus oedipus]|uniref:Uncharacterized protein n=1 Tax=Saguinus oedipus TaxID=9490 RepID=A0ABQ9UDB4_SAGOE|nr:hypothetical protein P7K49_026473 [Saguinus oedipus]